MRILCIDRFEGNFAVCEELTDPPKKPKNIRYFGIEKNELPSGAGEGSVLVLEDEGILRLDEKRTRERREKLGKLQSRLWK